MTWDKTKRVEMLSEVDRETLEWKFNMPWDENTTDATIVVCLEQPSREEAIKHE